MTIMMVVTSKQFFIMAATYFLCLSSHFRNVRGHGAVTCGPGVAFIATEKRLLDEKNITAEEFCSRFQTKHSCKNYDTIEEDEGGEGDEGDGEDDELIEFSDYSDYSDYSNVCNWCEEHKPESKSEDQSVRCVAASYHWFHCVRQIVPSRAELAELEDGETRGTMETVGTTETGGGGDGDDSNDNADGRKEKGADGRGTGRIKHKFDWSKSKAVPIGGTGDGQRKGFDYDTIGRIQKLHREKEETKETNDSNGASERDSGNGEL